MRSVLSNSQRLQYLEAMGIQQWVPKKGSFADPLSAMGVTMESTTTPKARKVEESVNAVSGQASSTTAIDWDALQKRVATCTACGLHETRIQTVFGVGNLKASCMVVGEAPGASEDQQGEPFVGKAGMLLNEMLRAIGLNREEVFIANILKCRPPMNRDPKPSEVDACEPFLKQQLAFIKPKIILAVGRVAAQNLLKTDTPLGKMRGKRHYYGEIPLVVLYHPAYLLRSPLEKRRAWDDLQFALEILREHD